MKDLDFLPDWYKQSKRRQEHMRRQYFALVLVFLIMMLFNVTATYRATTAAAKVATLENQRLGAEEVIHEFNGLTNRINELRTRANLVERTDSRVDIAAILAELSHTMDDTVVLRRLNILAESVDHSEDKMTTKGAVVRLAGKTAGSDPGASLGRTKFRLVLAGVAARPAAVPDLVCRLDRSSYFQKVQLSFYGNAKGQVDTRFVAPAQEAAAKASESSDVTEFEIVCYLANFKELPK